MPSRWINRDAGLSHRSKLTAGLHLGDFGIHDAETAAAEVEHRVELVAFLHALLNLLGRHAHFGSEVFLRGFLVWKELVQRRIEEADGGREAYQRFEDADEVCYLVREELGEREL